MAHSSGELDNRSRAAWQDGHWRNAPEEKWRLRCPGVVRSLQEGVEHLLTFFQFPQGSLPTEDAALVLLFGLVASGQVRLRRLDGWRHIPAVLRQRRRSAA